MPIDKSQKLQGRIGELELKLKQYEVAEIDKRNPKLIWLVLKRVINISRGKYKLKVWNSGQATAYKVTASIDKQANLIIIDSKCLLILDAGKSFDENLIVHGGTAGKFKIITTWEDKDGNTHQREQMGSL